MRKAGLDISDLVCSWKGPVILLVLLALTCLLALIFAGREPPRR